MKFPIDQPVVAPVDFSEQSFEAVRLARGLVTAPSQLHIVHVLPPISPMDPGVVWDAWDDKAREAHARDALKKQLGDQIAGSEVEIVIGDPAREVAERASQLGAGLIVLSSHGRTGTARLLIGSVAERIVRHAHCPVLVLRN